MLHFTFLLAGPSSSGSDCDIVAFPSCIINGAAVTKTFQILYRNEEVRLESVANFKVHVVAETGKARKKQFETLYGIQGGRGPACLRLPFPTNNKDKVIITFAR